MLIATLLTSNNESMIAEAAKSVVAVCERLLVIDTGVTDRSLEIAREVAGEKLIVEKFPWRQDFAAARNFALEAAMKHGGTWALTIDTDERLSFPAYNSAEALAHTLNAAPQVHAWFVPYETGHYAKERIIRLPTHLRWHGRTHETLLGATAAQRRTLPGASFQELPKTPEQFTAKLARDLQILLEETQTHPQEARWWYYLGQTYQGQKEFRLAVQAYRECFERDVWDEQAAWAMYQAATCATQLPDYRVAMQLCALGLSRSAGFPELAWLAGWCAYKLERWQQAIWWCRCSIALGHVEGCRAGEKRVSFRHLPGWYEAPYDVLRHVYRELREAVQFRWAQEQYEFALQQRQSKQD